MAANTGPEVIATLVDSRDEGKAASSRLETFEWPHEGASDVRLTGDFLGWVATGIPMQREGNKWTVSLRLTPGMAHYKYICDGEAWLYSPTQRFQPDEYGNINNVREVLPPSSVDSSGTQQRPSPVNVPPTSGALAAASTPTPPLMRAATTPVPQGGASAAAVPQSFDPHYQHHAHAASADGGRPPHGSGYVAKALREHTAEFSLPVDVGPSSSSLKRTTLARSASVGDVSSLRDVGSGRLGGLGPRTGMMGSDYAGARRMGGAGAGGGLTPRHTGRVDSPSSLSASGGGGSAGMDSSLTGTPVLAGAPPSFQSHLPMTLSFGAGRDTTTDMSVMSPLPETSGESPTASIDGSVNDLTAATAGMRMDAASAGGSSELGEEDNREGGYGDSEGDAGLSMDEPMAVHGLQGLHHAPASGGAGIQLSISAQLLSSLVPALAAQQQAATAAKAARTVAAAAVPPTTGLAAPAPSGGPLLPKVAPGSPSGGPLNIGLPKVPSDAASGMAKSGSSSSGGSLHASTLMSPAPYPHAPGTTIMTSVQASLLREGKLVLAFVGAPAVGKTFMARRLKRHLSWIGYRAEIFNVGNYRRALLGAHQPADFFSPHNPVGEAQRSEMARLAFEDMCAALHSGVCDISIFDATNSTRERRQFLKAALAEQERKTGVKHQLVFIESVCTDEAIVRANVRETKLKSPDYRDMPEDVAVADFLARIKHYKSVYQTLSEEHEGEQPFIKLIDVGRILFANRINGYLNSRIMWFLSHLHITPRPIWLTRHGESQYNVQGLIGGDSLLSPRGVTYSHKLASFMDSVYPRESAELVVWTSSLRRTQQTASSIGRDIVQWKALDEIDAGICDGMTYEAIAAAMPEEYAARARNKFTYRYPRGESYQDMVTRLEPVLIELMRQKDPIIIVSHQATLRVLYAYLTDRPPESCPDVLFPLHTLVQLTPKAYGCEEVRHELYDSKEAKHK